MDQLLQLQQFVNVCDWQVVEKKEKWQVAPDEFDAEGEKIQDLHQQIDDLLAEAEKLAAAGKVEDLMVMMLAVEEAKKEYRSAESAYHRRILERTKQSETLRVCEVCSGAMFTYSSDRRVIAHEEGKIHIGFVRVRERLAELQAEVAVSIIFTLGFEPFTPQI